MDANSVHAAYAERGKNGQLVALDSSRRSCNHRRSTARIRDWTTALLILSSFAVNGNDNTKQFVSGFPFFHSRSYAFDHRIISLDTPAQPAQRHENGASCKTVHLYFGTDQGYGADAGLSNNSREDLSEQSISQGVRSLGATSLYHRSLSNNAMETSVGDETFGLYSLGDIMSCPEDKPLSKECSLSHRNNLAPDYPFYVEDSNRQPTLQIGNDDALDVAGGGTLGDIMSFPEHNPNEMSQYLQDNTYQNNATEALDANPDAGDKIHLRESEATGATLNVHLDSNTSRSSGLVTSVGGTLQSQFGRKMRGHLSPLERIALTANGNLQRIFSSYYDAPVHVHVEFCEKRTSQSNSANAASPQATSNGMAECVGNFDRILTSRRDSTKEVLSNTWDRRVVLIVHSKVSFK
jgi:hypothetical protein